MTLAELAGKLRPVIERAAASLDDRTASTAAPLFPRLRQGGALVKAGTRINWNGAVKRAVADLWDTRENDPDHAAVLWADIDYRDGCRIIPETITAGAAFTLDECGWWNGALYRSKLEANVFTPDAYPDGWEPVNG